MKKALLIAGSLALGSQAALAGEWDGFYVGGGIAQTEYTNSYTDRDYDWFGGTLEESTTRVTPSVHVGYNMSNENVVFGIEADYRQANMRTDTYYSFDVFKQDQFDSSMSARLRLGIASGNTLVYATAGVAQMETEHQWIEDDDVPDSWPAFENDKTGQAIGFGIERKVGDTLSIRGEWQRITLPHVTEFNIQRQHRFQVEDASESVGIGASFHF
ncbi:MAG: outer membrane protein [Alcanivoracaceae bacterium]